MHNDFPLVSIVTVNYNQEKVTCELLDTLARLSYPNVEVIVIDNGSKKGYDIIKEKYPWVVFERIEKNRGFASGNNVGMKLAKGEYIIMLNNDTEVEPDFIQPLIKRMQSDPKIGLVSPKLLFYHSPGIIQYAGATAINPFTGRGFSIGTHELDKGQYDEAIRTDRGHGAAMMMSREAFNRVGPMYEEYYLYYEEMDYCEMVKRAGFTIWYEPACAVQHKESITNDKHSPLKTFYLTRNRLWFMKRNFSTFHFITFLFYFTTIVVPVQTLKLLVQRKTNHLKAFYLGIFNFQAPRN